MNSLETVQKFINHIFSGELEAALKLVASRCTIYPGEGHIQPRSPYLSNVHWASRSQ